MASDYRSMVKYFTQADDGDAQKLADAIESFFASKGCPLEMQVVPASTSKAANPPLEAWISHKCS